MNPLDDRFHGRNSDPHWNESHLMTFHNVEANLMGTIYYYYRPNMNMCVGEPILWNGDGEDSYNCLYYAWDQGLAMPANAEMNEFEWENGLKVSTGELQKQYRFQYQASDCEIDLTYNALMEPHYMSMEGDNINPGIIDWMTAVGPNVSLGHYEQAGWMTGAVTVRGTTYDIDSGALRDHTWGPRKHVTNLDRRLRAWPFVVASRDSSFQIYAMQEAPLDQDPIVGTTERITSGWYTRDGVKGTLVSGTRRCVERGPDGLSSRHAGDEAPDQRVTATEWMAADREARLSDDVYREITEHDLVDGPAELGLIDDRETKTWLDHGTEDLRAVAAREDSGPDEDLIRVPTYDETADAVLRAQRALNEIRARVAAEAAYETENAYYSRVRDWHYDDQAADRDLDDGLDYGY